MDEYMRNIKTIETEILMKQDLIKKMEKKKEELERFYDERKKMEEELKNMSDSYISACYEFIKQQPTTAEKDLVMKKLGRFENMYFDKAKETLEKLSKNPKLTELNTLKKQRAEMEIKKHSLDSLKNPLYN